ncbi:MAG TPA: nucleotidyl transferase AbiEii/AbiGii toxin family protein [Chlorobaculum sp.]|nr:nucleotidyl transferase AbiEii/AbiGii toxin family protein [Chlorobaculum sp.]
MKQILTRSETGNAENMANGLRSAMQEVALAGLARSGFFEHAAFCGATCLRIFYGLSRFSESLDFCLLKPDAEFSLHPYLDVLWNEFAAMGLDMEILLKKKTGWSCFDSAFLKKDTRLVDFAVSGESTLKITFELDTEPPSGYSIEEKLLIEPYPSCVTCVALSDLFAEKMHLLLFRNHKTRGYGRDWFDFEWYIRNRIPLNFKHFVNRSVQSGHMTLAKFSEQDLERRLKNRIDAFDKGLARKEASVFVHDPDALDIWSTYYFQQLASRLIIIRQEL